MKMFKTFAYFDGDSVSPPPPASPPPPPTPGAITFTPEQQQHINKLMAEQKRSIQDQNKDLIKQLEDLRQKSSLTQAEKDELDNRIQSLQQQHLTKEQQQSAELEKLNKKYKSDTDALSAEGKKWQTNFNNMLIENAILSGASKHNAANPEQLQLMLSSKAKVVEQLGDDGKPTGKFVVKLPMTVEDAKTKQPVQVELDMVEAIGKMREEEQHANLFLVDGKPGFGGNNANRPGVNGASPDFSKMSPEQYSEWRKKQNLSARR